MKCDLIHRQFYLDPNFTPYSREKYCHQLYNDISRGLLFIFDKIHVRSDENFETHASYIFDTLTRKLKTTSLVDFFTQGFFASYNFELDKTPQLLSLKKKQAHISIDVQSQPLHAIGKMTYAYFSSEDPQNEIFPDSYSFVSVRFKFANEMEFPSPIERVVKKITRCSYIIDTISQYALYCLRCIYCFFSKSIFDDKATKSLTDIINERAQHTKFITKTPKSQENIISQLDGCRRKGLKDRLAEILSNSSLDANIYIHKDPILKVSIQLTSSSFDYVKWIVLTHIDNTYSETTTTYTPDWF